MESDEDPLGGGFNAHPQDFGTIRTSGREEYAVENASPVSPFQHHHTESSRDKGKKPLRPVVTASLSVPQLYTDNLHGITVVVRNPLKHNDSGNIATQAYTSYELYTETRLPHFPSQTSSVRRRFQDFVSFHGVLAKNYPTIILPPLPEKHRLDYLDRFSEEFIERRRQSLERFLGRLCSHHILHKSNPFMAFLTDSAWIPEHYTPDVKESVLENMSESILNAFAKVRKIDDRFAGMSDSIKVYEENLTTVEKLCKQDIETQKSTIDDMIMLAAAFKELGNSEGKIGAELMKVANCIESVAASLSRMALDDEAGFLAYVHDHIGYCHSAKDVLKSRDQKQIDFESLTEYLSQQINEREKLQSNVRGGSLASFFKSKYDEFKGVDPERARQDRLGKLEQKISELREAVDTANDTLEKFSTEVNKSVATFEETKTYELRGMLESSIRNRQRHYQDGLEQWDALVAALEAE